MTGKITIEVCNRGTIVYRMSDQIHRDDGPAVEQKDGYNEWFKHGVLHRLDGPAISGGKNNFEPEYWIDGLFYTREEFELHNLRLVLTEVGLEDIL